ncbi:unnamed protein product [Rotaria socialis]|uniref:Uncharacterized protein n=1 Tax=Rotaria socialis TaxID=392032 RepID=A0A820W692_9BILA|nr:unnamed protein product [Rotaria socialis]CAF4512881.1 unnamed protein product [Rotaria socialis]
MIEKQEAINGQCELGCFREEVDFIRSNLANLVTNAHRAIWFTYQRKLNDQSSGSKKSISSTYRAQNSSRVLYDIGSMFSYDKFIGHILNSRYPASTKIYKDTRGRPKSIVLERLHK